MPFTHYRTKGIFLKKENRGEADQLFTIFTEDFGKLEILARGIRKIKSKLRSGAELFYFSEIEFIQGKIYKTLTDAILIDKFKNIRGNFEKLALAYKIGKAIDIFLPKEEKDEKIWKLLLGTFQQLNLSSPSHSLTHPLNNSSIFSLVYYYFLWNIFSILGFKPEIYFCPICGKKLLPETFWFSPKEGGVVCWRCFRQFDKEEKQSSKAIEVDTVKVLRIFLSEDFGILSKLKIEEKIKENLIEVSEAYFNFLEEEFSKIEK